MIPHNSSKKKKTTKTHKTKKPKTMTQKTHTQMNEQDEQLFCTVRNYSPFLRAFFKDF